MGARPRRSAGKYIASVCKHAVRRNGQQYCKKCWRNRGPEGAKKTYIATVCGHPCSRHGGKYCQACYREQRADIQGHGRSRSTIHDDRALRFARTEDRSLKKKYDESLRHIETMERSLETYKALDNIQESYVFEPRKSSGSHSSEGVVVAVASDWHIEERVGAEVGDLNRYTPEIATARAKTFFQGALRLTKLLQQDITIKQMILPLLGDFITNDIHDAENAEMNALLPTHALAKAQALIIAGFELILRETKLEIVVPCHSGNHARTTKTTRFGAENGHSLEYLMYLHLAAYFRDEKRITFLIPEGIHSYVTVYDHVIRFHHGHAIKYGGGVGGIYIPVNKSIAAWNRGRRADLDVFGHFHQLRDGGNFICNGSLIGYNAFALSIKADFDRPKQALFLIDKKRGRTCTWPILFDQ